MSHAIIQHILVVDDEKPFGTLVQNFLQSLGYMSETAADAFEALDKLRLNSFDLVITDIKMPDKDGLELMREVREINPQIEFIVMTGHAGEYSYSDIIAAGAVDFIAKPFATAELQAKIQRLDREKAVLQDLRQAHQELQDVFNKVQRAKQEWESTADSLPNLICLVDHQGNIMRSNRIVETWKLMSLTKVRGINFHQLLHPVCTDPDCFLQSFLVQAWDELDAGRVAECQFKDDLLGKFLHIQVRSISGTSNSTIVEGTNQGAVIYVNDITAEKQKEEILRQSEEKYRRLVDNIPGSVFQANADWTVDFLDPRIEELIGYGAEEFTSGRMKWSEIILAEDIPQTKEILKQALKKDKKYARKYRLRTRAGKIVWVRERSQIICNKEGRIEYISGIFFDITHLQEAEEALQKAHNELELRVEERTAEISQLNKLLQTIYSVIPDLIVLKDRNLSYLSINQAFCRFLNQSPDQIIGKNDYDLFPPAEAKTYQQADITIINSGTPQVTEEYITGAEKQRWFQVVRTPVRDETGAIIGILYSCRDITVRKKAEESIRLHRARLQELSKPITED